MESMETNYQIWYLNINGGLSDTSRNHNTTLHWLKNKLDNTSENRKPIAICFCETKLKPYDKNFKINGYNSFRLDSRPNQDVRARGGILIFVRNKSAHFTDLSPLRSRSSFRLQ